VRGAHIQRHKGRHACGTTHTSKQLILKKAVAVAGNGGTKRTGWDANRDWTAIQMRCQDRTESSTSHEFLWQEHQTGLVYESMICFCSCYDLIDQLFDDALLGSPNERHR
jgi:hypothetical protein